MSGMEVEGQGSETGTEEVSVAPEINQEGGDSTNPAWSELLDIIPSQLHSQVTPHLSKWDRNYQDGINKVHSQYEAYKPYAEKQIAPDQINYALQVAQAIETNPQKVLSALQEFLGIEQAPQKEEQGQTDEDEIPAEFVNHPEFQSMRQMVETMAQLMVQQNQSQQASKEDEMLATELASLKETYGEYDEEWVLTKALALQQAGQEATLEDVVKKYKEFESNLLSKARQPGPKILPAGGVAPDNQAGKPSQLGDSERKKYVAQILAAANQQNQ